jgi:hypothetical protein
LDLTFALRDLGKTGSERQIRSTAADPGFLQRHGTTIEYILIPGAALDLDELLELSDCPVVMFHGQFVYEARASEADLTEVGRHMAGH